ncbi:hypothetical protein HON36_00160 [Candidatus Parcubacteria bacterium]|jgi:hypothetical protein|nr:hypothetical protein [Candidatus Parcubacteria bacterium]MBT7228541.1 hypothetical protein [Candidatus Parcubacteria bacterium]
MSGTFEIHVLPRQVMTQEQFLSETPPCSIALDGVVSGGPYFDPVSLHINFDHHDNVVREATMSTAKQVFVAIKGGLMKSFREDGRAHAHIYINDTDQDTSLAVWLLMNYTLFEGTQSVPLISRILDLSDKWDITGGAFPVNLKEEVVRQHNWIFEPYSNLRKSGQLANADADVMRDNLDAVMARLTKAMMGEAGEVDLDTRHEILCDHPIFKIVDEIGGNEARYYLYSQGMNAFVSIVARREDKSTVYVVGRRSQYIPFPVSQILTALNQAEFAKRGKELVEGDQWGGSDLIGGSPRSSGSVLTWEEIKDVLLNVVE